MSGKKIAIAGFQHETNTFAPMPTTYAEFEMGGSWPALTSGQDIFSTFEGLNIPVSGFIAAADDWELVPLLWTAAEPAGYVATAGFNTIMDRLCGQLQSCLLYTSPSPRD